MWTVRNREQVRLPLLVDADTVIEIRHGQAVRGFALLVSAEKRVGKGRLSAKLSGAVSGWVVDSKITIKAGP